MKGDDVGGEADEKNKGTRRLKWADRDDKEEEEEVRQGAAEGEWHKARQEQRIEKWTDCSDDEQSERCEHKRGSERNARRGERQWREEKKRWRK